jgi:putative transposase
MEHRSWTSRGYLPHCDGGDLIQHIVFGTIDAGEGIERHFGAHFLANREAASIVQDALLHFDGERYALCAWCVMPNHVHVVATQMHGWPLSRIVHSWKSFTANRINAIHQRTGPIWLREYFDRFMRHNDDLSTVIAYVERNPVKAGLVERDDEWAWSSARLR